MVISPTEQLPGVSLKLPSDFHLLPLDPDLANRVAAQSELLDALPLAGGDRRELVALYVEALATRLRDADVAGAAFCAVRIDDHASTATLTVGYHSTATTDRTLALLGTVATLRGSEDMTSVETTTYAGHPAATWIAERVLPGSDGGADDLVLRELQVLVQAPEEPVAVLITLATPNLEDWPIYRDVVRSICETIEFQPALDSEESDHGRVLLLPVGDGSGGREQ
ncbi:MAG: hypothetical protein GEU93_10300 [Propionibacteriales bacterium]|nr:hypothetical protein [Propionibacteriales bacterium]